MTGGASEAQVLTVSEVTRRVRGALESAFPGRLLVAGELSNFKIHASGHSYFTLKDSGSEIACVMWRSAVASLKFRPADGQEVIVAGSIEVFEKSGRYQLYAQRIDPRGVGALELALRQLREKLEKEGLFSPARKRPLPRFPKRIGIITSPTGAAIRDMLLTLERRYPCVEVLVLPARVQGDGAATEIADAVRKINAASSGLGGVDLLIVGRGGGSTEDLWAFNEEVVVRAIAASAVPVISAVGHETDFTLADLAADVRAATPTAAAELAVPVRLETLDVLGTTLRRVTVGARRRLDQDRRTLSHLARRAPFREPEHLIRRREQQLDALLADVLRALNTRFHDRRRRLQRAEQLLSRIAPDACVAAGTRRLHERLTRLQVAMTGRLLRLARNLDQRAARLQRGAPAGRMPRLNELLIDARRRVALALRQGLDARRRRLDAAEQLLNALSYRSVLQRGYSITRLKKGGSLVRDAARLSDGDRLVTELAEGEVESRVVNARQRELFET
ncbi:MAG: Exodeoxyribonuclease 7 large subunit [Phycisphaerae bacterium]|nr:Exodeoxyribonuclease 7 large subunit [Phycisphaerae bacterium]